MSFVQHSTSRENRSLTLKAYSNNFKNPSVTIALMFLSMPVYSSEGATAGRIGDLVLPAPILGSGLLSKGGEGCISGLVAQREVRGARQPRQTPQESRGCREISAHAGASTQLFFHGFLLFFFFFLSFIFPESQRLVFLQVFLPLLLLRFSGVPCWQEWGGESCFSWVCLELVTTCY